MSSLTLPQGPFEELRLILGDQLNAQHSWYKQKHTNVLYVIAELHQEAQYVKHHVQKLCAFFIAMEHFAKALKHAGHKVLHLTLDDSTQFDDLPHLLSHLCQQLEVKRFAYQRPDEYRLLAQLQDLELDGVVSHEVDTEHFLLPFDELDTYFKPGQHNRMESFYRKMRQRFGWLMHGDKPLGGKWNYDAANRNKLKAHDLEVIPEPLCFGHATAACFARIQHHNIPHFGQLDEALRWPCTRSEALALLDYFCAHGLPHFGTFQDAMTGRSPHSWSLYHSRLSFALNAKMISPRQVIERAIDAFEQHDDMDIAQIEGFVRQILGWREYVRGVYWVNMPQYSTQNHYHARRDLPEFFWTGNTNMRCLQQAITQSLETAYAHHIQRLMVTGNFCLLAGINPEQVDAWYLGIYVDAIEWVELPNTRGMSLFADGGWIATKPYSASGNYINKMSDYCSDCDYQVKEAVGDQACPLNSLYWNFMHQHRDSLSNNPRIGMLYGNWDKRSESDRDAILQRAQWCLKNLETL
ncbi:MAG: cryptochrome/photolyase family protein [Oleiphilaceae bacterium]|nr:cryptochrome/photolyase family protein [Oleiphilaceae bacterium]